MIKKIVSGLRIIWVLAIGIPMRIVEIMLQILPENSWGCRIRGLVYKPFLKACGVNFQVGLAAKLEHKNNISVGDNVYIGHGSWVSGLRGGVDLEDEVLIGPYVTMVSSNHSFVDGSSRFGPGIGGKIRIGRGCWLAAGSSVVAGVSVGAGSLVAGGAVVTKDVASGTIVGGVPAKVIGKTADLDTPVPNSQQ